jgi:hypothetical protein
VPWLNADSKMYAHPKMRAAGLEAMGLWLMGGTYSADVLTDGHVPDWIVQSWPGGPELAQRLIDAELWEPAPGGYQVLEDGIWRVSRLKYGDSRQSVAPDLRAIVYERDGHACRSCGCRDDLTVDHIYPWSLGGTDDLDNLQTLCRSCNSKKGAKVGI